MSTAQPTHQHTEFHRGTIPSDQLASGVLHVHVIGEQMTGDGAATAFLLAQEAEADQPPAAYVNGTRTDVTLGGMNDTITFGSAPAAAATIRVDYLAAVG